MTDYLTVAEIAAHLRVSKMTVHRLVNAGILPAVRVGRSIRVTQPDLDTYIQASRVGGVA